MDKLYLWRVGKRGNRVHIENPETKRTYCQVENCGGRPLDGRGAEVPAGRRVCGNCIDLAGRNETDYREPDLKVLLGERVAGTDPELFPGVVNLPVPPQKRPRYSEAGNPGAVAPKLWKRKRAPRRASRPKGRKPRRSTVKYPRPFNDDLPW